MADVKIDIYADHHGAPDQLKGVETGLKGIEDQGGKTHAGLGNLWKQFALGQIAADLLVKAGKGIIDFMGDCIKGAIDEENSQKKLETALLTTGRTRSGTLKDLQTYAVELSKSTLYTHEQGEASITLLAQMTKLDTNGLKAATRGAMGLASVLGKDLDTASMILVKAMEGNVGALKRAGIEIDTTKSKEDQHKEILEKLAPLYLRAEADAKTFGGELHNLGKWWDEVKEAVGGAITKNESIKQLIIDLKDKVIELVQSGKLEEWARIASDAIAKLVSQLGFAFDLIKSLPGGFPALSATISDHIMGIDKDLSKLETEGRTKVVNFRNSLQIIKPTMEEMRKEIEKGPEAWAAYTARLKDSDDKLIANKTSIMGAFDKFKDFLGLHDTAPTKINETGNALGEMGEKTKTLVEELGILTRTNLEDKLKQWWEAWEKYGQTGQLSIKVTQELKEKIQGLEKELYGTAKSFIETLPPAQNFSDILKKTPKSIDSATYSIMTFEESLHKASDAMAVSEATIIHYIYNIERQFMAMRGIILPVWEDLPKGAKKATAETKNYFDGLYNDIASGWGNTIQKWLEGGLTLKNFTKQLWDDIKNSFFRVIGEMIAEWSIKLVKQGIEGIISLGKSTADTVSGIGSSISNVAGSIGGLVTGLVSSIATSAVTLATGVATVIVTLATAVATAITTLAAVAPALVEVGIAAAAVYGAFKLAGTLVDAIGSFFGGAQKQTDVTYWLKYITDHAQDILNYLTSTQVGKLQQMTEQLQDLVLGSREERNQLQAIVDISNDIRKYTGDAAGILGKIKFAASGMNETVYKPTMIIAGEGMPGHVRITASGKDRGDAPTIITNHYHTWQIQAIDKYSIQNLIRDEFIPFINRLNIARQGIKI